MLDTSLAAYRAQTPSKKATDYERILAYCRSQGAHGTTADAVEIYLNSLHQTISARIGELVKQGRLVRLAETRLTRARKPAHVIVAAEFYKEGVENAKA